MLKVNEIFGPTIQGEGRTAGKEVVFLRLAGCNLHCVWCDTPYTWNWIGSKWSHPDKFDPKDEIHEMSTCEVVEQLAKIGTTIASVVISGGEPLIQQKQLEILLVALHNRNWWIEIETNGTIPPNKVVRQYVNQFNVSPKLSNSGDKKQLRFRPQAMSVFAQMEKATFKFVIGSTEDVSEVMEYVKEFGLPNERVYLMPLGKTPDELKITMNLTEQLCNRFGFIFSDRLHVHKFGGVRGV